MRFIVCPSFADVSDALDWFEERGAKHIVMWRGADGLVRGTAIVRTAA